MKIKFENVEKFSSEEKKSMLTGMNDYRRKVKNFGIVDSEYTLLDVISKKNELEEISEITKENDEILDEIKEEIKLNQEKIEFYDDLYSESDRILGIYYNIVLKRLEKKLFALYDEYDYFDNVAKKDYDKFIRVNNKYRQIIDSVSHKRFVDKVEEELKKELRK